MRVYRAICLACHSPQKLSTVGLYWSSGIDGAYCYGCKVFLTKHYYIYQAQISARFIDIAATKQNNKQWPHEKEVKFFPGALVKVEKVYKMRRTTQKLLKSYHIKFKTKT